MRVCGQCETDISDRHGRALYCTQCAEEKLRERDRKNHRKWREANPEKVREQKRLYYAANREKVMERQRKYRETNRGIP